MADDKTIHPVQTSAAQRMIVGRTASPDSNARASIAAENRERLIKTAEAAERKAGRSNTDADKIKALQAGIKALADENRKLSDDLAKATAGKRAKTRNTDEGAGEVADDEKQE